MSHDPDAVVRAILAQAAYRPQSRAGADDEWWYAFWEWVGKLFRPLDEALRAVAGRDSRNLTIVAACALVLAALALGFVAYRVGSRLVRPSVRNVTRGRREEASASRPAGAILASAIEASRAGRYREAAVLLYLACVHALDQSGRIPYAASRTVGEYRLLVARSAPGLSEPFAQTSALFTRAVYAGETPSPAQLEMTLAATRASALFDDAR